MFYIRKEICMTRKNKAISYLKCVIDTLQEVEKSEHALSNEHLKITIKDLLEILDLIG